MAKDKGGDAGKDDNNHELTDAEAEELADKVIWKLGQGPRDQPPPQKGK